MFKKMLSKVGVGGAKVDTVLKDLPVVRGHALAGEVQIEGGKVEQLVEQVYLELFTTYTYENHDCGIGSSTTVLHRLNIAESFELLPRELKTFPFELEVPLVSPITVGRPFTFLRTGLDVKGAVDPKDRDPVAIAPDPASEKLLQAIETLGFEHTTNSGGCIEMENPSGVPYIQEFQYEAVGEISRSIKFLDVLLLVWDEEIEIELLVGARRGGISGLVGGEEERKINFTLAHEADFSADDLQGVLEDALNA